MNDCHRKNLRKTFKLDLLHCRFRNTLFTLRPSCSRKDFSAILRNWLGKVSVLLGCYQWNNYNFFAEAKIDARKKHVTQVRLRNITKNCGVQNLLRFQLSTNKKSYKKETNLLKTPCGYLLHRFLAKYHLSELNRVHTCHEKDEWRITYRKKRLHTRRSKQPALSLSKKLCLSDRFILLNYE